MYSIHDSVKEFYFIKNYFILKDIEDEKLALSKIDECEIFSKSKNFLLNRIWAKKNSVMYSGHSGGDIQTNGGQSSTLALREDEKDILPRDIFPYPPTILMPELISKCW